MEAMKSRQNREGRSELAPGIIGDVPHGWVAAHYILLVRDMLAREEGDKLHVLACVPPEWFADGKAIELLYAPTMFGLLDLQVKTENGRTRIRMTAEQPPSGGWWITLPRPGDISKVLIDGKESPTARVGEVQLPSTARNVEIVYR